MTHGKQTSDEGVVDDALEPPRWWPVDGFGLDWPDLDEPVVRIGVKLHPGVEYANDIQYEMTDSQGRVIRGEWTETGFGLLTGLASPPDERGRLLGHLPESDAE